MVCVVRVHMCECEWCVGWEVRLTERGGGGGHRVSVLMYSSATPFLAGRLSVRVAISVRVATNTAFIGNTSSKVLHLRTRARVRTGACAAHCFAPNRPRNMGQAQKLPRRRMRRVHSIRIRSFVSGRMMGGNLGQRAEPCSVHRIADYSKT